MTELEKALKSLEKAKKKLGDREVILLIEDAIEELEELQSRLEENDMIDKTRHKFLVSKHFSNNNKAKNIMKSYCKKHNLDESFEALWKNLAKTNGSKPRDMGIQNQIKR